MMRFLSDDEGRPSSMRLMSLISLLTAVGLAVLQVFGHGQTDTLVLYFLSGSFGPKVFQKFAEKTRSV